MNDTTTIELRNIDSEDISDVLQKVEKSFGFKFDDTELKDVKTFGELCDIITNKVYGDNLDDCTTQQAFYKVRNAVVVIQHVNKDLVAPDTYLEELFPKETRRKRIKDLQKELNMSFDILDIKNWLGWTIFIGVTFSLIMLLFEWQFGFYGLLFFITVSWIAYKFFAKEFKLKTVGELTKMISRENYQKSRRNHTTVNRNEVTKKVKELFVADLDLEDDALTKNSTFV